MRIAIFTNNYLPNPFGVSKSILSFRKEFEKNGNDVFVFAPHAKGYEDEYENVFRFPSFDLNYKISFPLPIPFSGKASNELGKLDLDVIHSQHPNLLGFAAQKWSKRKNIPLVFTWHALYDQYVHFAPPFIPKKLATLWTIRNAVNYANKADYVIAPTGSVKKIMKDWGVTNKNIEVIPTGVDELVLQDPDGEEVRKKFNISNDDFVVLLLARISPEKNIGFIFECVKRVLETDRKTKFLVVGEGSLTTELKEKVIGWGLERQVIFAGLAGENEKKNYYAAGDMFVYASKSETQGMVISEAMYMGLPIVAVKAPGSQDLIMDGTSGFLVSEDQREFAEAINRLKESSALRERFSGNAKKIASENYTSKICAKKLMEIYKKAIKLKS